MKHKLGGGKKHERPLKIQRRDKGWVMYGLAALVMEISENLRPRDGGRGQKKQEQVGMMCWPRGEGVPGGRLSCIKGAQSHRDFGGTLLFHFRLCGARILLTDLKISKRVDIGKRRASLWSRETHG